jgi:uncharacterized phiE125 gp8 family phage protein
MRLVVEEPAEPEVTWADADAHLELDGDETRQAAVEGMIGTAWEHLNGPDGWLGRSLGEQIVDYWLDGFCDGDIPLPLGPVQEILSIKYRHPSTGVWVTLPTDQYEQRGDVVGPAFGMPTHRAWPSVASIAEPVHIQYRAGFRKLPRPIRSAILLMVADLFENPGSTSDAGSASAIAVPMSLTVQNLLDPAYRRYVIG